MLKALRTSDARVGSSFDFPARQLLLLCSVLALVQCLVYQGYYLLFPYTLDYGEGPLLDQAVRFAAGQSIYRGDLSIPPYTVSNYPPLYVALLAPLVRLFGVSGALLGGRLLSIFCAWSVAACLAWLVFRATRDRLAAFASVAVFVAFPMLTYWSSLLRVDLLALALSVGGLTLLLQRPTDWRFLLGSTLLLSGAIFTRQSYALAAPLATFCCLLSLHKKHAVVFALLLSTICFSVFVALNLLTHGGFYLHIVTANLNQFDIERLLFSLAYFFEVALIPAVLAGVGMLVWREPLPLRRLIPPYTAAAAISALTIGKIGSNVNYFSELCAALSLGVGVFVAWNRSRKPGVEVEEPQALQYLPSLRLIVLSIGLVHMCSVNWNGAMQPMRAQWSQLPELQKLDALLAKTSGKILADEYLGILTLQQRPFLFQPFEMTQLSRAGHWQQQDFVRQIESREFSAIVIQNSPWIEERWTPEMLAAIKSSYVQADEIAGNLVYLPRAELSD